MKASKVETFYTRETTFREGLGRLRELALKTGLEETYKWNAPVYTLDKKNVFGITAFASHFGIWFFNGCYLKDPKNVLGNAQEGKTKAMRHWKFTSAEQIDTGAVLCYMQEAVENQRKGLVWKPERQQKKTNIPPELLQELRKDPALQKAFDQLAPYKQRGLCEYITSAKRESTRLNRLEKAIPMIREGVGINDSYRK